MDFLQRLSDLSLIPLPTLREIIYKAMGQNPHLITQQLHLDYPDLSFPLEVCGDHRYILWAAKSGTGHFVPVAYIKENQ